MPLSRVPNCARSARLLADQLVSASSPERASSSVILSQLIKQAANLKIDDSPAERIDCTKSLCRIRPRKQIANQNTFFDSSINLATGFRTTGVSNHFHGQVIPSRRYSSKSGKRKTRKKDDSSSSSSSSSSDSESDRKYMAKGYKYRKGNSEIWRKKMRTHHQLLDLNHDGVVSWDDFQVLIKNFTEVGGLNDDEIETFTDTMKHVWEEEWGASGDPYAFITQEQFLQNMENVVNNKKASKRVAGPLPYFFKAVDRDGSGEISVEEFKVFFKCMGLSEQDAMVTFAAIDINGDARLSMKEFVKLGRNFFLTEDEACSSNLFWGPLAL